MSEPSRIPPGARYALAIVGLTQAMSLLDRNILAILAPEIKKDLNIGNAEMGLLYGTVFALFYALFSLPVGRLADGWFRTRLLAISITFWSIATGMAAFASGFAMLALSRLGVGIGEAATQPAGTSLVYDYWPKERRGFVMAVMASAIALGLGGSSILGGFAADWWNRMNPGSGLKGWQFAFIVAAVPGFLLAILLWRLREPERGVMDGIPTPADPAPFAASGGVLASVLPGLNWLTFLQRGAAARLWLLNLGALALIIAAMMMATRTATAFSPRPALVLGGLSINPHALQWSVVGFGLIVIVNLLQGLSLSDRPAFAVITRSPALMMAMAIGALQTMINYGIMGFTPSYLMAQFKLTPSQVGLNFGLLSAAIGIVGPMITGPLSDRINLRWPGSGRIWVTLFSLGLSPLIALWVYAAEDSTSFYLRFVIYSIVLTGWLPPLYAVMYDQVLPRMRGLMTSLYLILTTILGLGIGPYLVGLIADAKGGQLAPAMLAINWVAPVIVVLLVLLALRVRRDEDGLMQRARDAGEPI
jgi:MFS family permease